jgi:hypothetical protein
MAFWNHKKQDKAELDETFRRFIEVMEKHQADMIRTSNELTKALDKATREFKRSRS